MPTRSLTFFYNDDGEKLFCLYRHMDGAPHWHGQELCVFLQKQYKLSNSPGCLAASVIAQFKTESGNFYLLPANTKNADQVFEYHVYSEYDNYDLVVRLKVFSVPYKGRKKCIFKGTLSDFPEYVASLEE